MFCLKKFNETFPINQLNRENAIAITVSSPLSFMPLTQALGLQLAQPGLQLLALPRPPGGVLAATHLGRFAQLEIALHLFVSHAVRKIRMATGDPSAILAAHDNGELRITLSSPFDESLIEGFCWPLHPLDDLADIELRIVRLLAECRVSDVRVIGAPMSDKDDGGRTLYVHAHNIDEFSI